MEAVIPPKWIDEQRAKLTEGDVYIIQYFEVCNARAMYRAVAHPYMARFTKHTKIIKVSVVSPNFPLYACSITPFHVRRERVGTREQMSDAIGVFTKCSRISKQSTRNGIQSLVNVHITDGRDNTVLALWGSHAERFDGQSLMEMSKNAPVVLLFVGVTSSTFDGRLMLQCSTTVAWYVNPALPETTILQQSFGVALCQAYWIGEQSDKEPQTTTVTELSAIDNPHEAEGNTYKVTAKIKELVPNEQWSYLACNKCKRSTRANGDSYKCYDPECIGTDAIPRYKIAFIATDPEVPPDGEEKAIEIICFGAVAEEMVGLPADNLLGLSSNVQGYIPEQIKRLFGTKFDFKFSVPRGAIRRGKTTFRVDSFTRVADHEEQGLNETPIGTTNTSEKTLSAVPTVPNKSSDPGIAKAPDESMPDVPAVPSKNSDQPFNNDSTPVKDALGIDAPQMTATPALTKEKRAIDDPNAKEDLEDSDCENRSSSKPPVIYRVLQPKQSLASILFSLPSMKLKKKPRAARKLSMAAEDDE